MILDIENISSKSFRNFSSEEKFAKANIIFGTNGSGKTALSDWLINQELEHRVFNTEYVQQNIFAQDEIDGVKLTVGNESINIEENVQRIRDANINLNIGIQILKKNIELEKDGLYQMLNQTLQQAKSQFSLKVNINQKQNARNNPLNALKLWYSEMEELGYQENSSKELEQEKLIMEGKIDKLNFHFNIDKERFEKMVRELKKPTMVPSTGVTNDIVRWIQDGLHIHNMEESSTICQFCGNSFNGEKVAEIIKEKTSTIYAKLIAELEKYKDDLFNLTESIDRLPVEEKCEEVSNKIKYLINIINEKIENTTKVFTIEKDVFKQVYKLSETINKKTIILKKNLEDINEKIRKVEQVAKSWIGQELKDNLQVNNYAKNIKNMKRNMSVNQGIIEENESWMENLQKSSSDLKPFKDLVNQQFKLIGVGFRLDIMTDNKHYLITHNSLNINLKTKDLSEGERRLLGFLHFYYDLFDKPHESLMADIKLVIIDDPITSLDNDNRYYLTELINKFIKEVSDLECQFFLFTHSSFDFHNIGYGSNKIASFFKVSKNSSGESQIMVAGNHERQNYSDYYQANFKEIFKFAQCSKSKISEFNFLSFGNKTRLVFESHARTHYRLENTTKSSIDKLITFYEVKTEFKDQFIGTLDIVNSLSHGMTFADYNQISAKEVQDAVRFILAVLYKKDRYHVEEMVDDLVCKANNANVMVWLNQLNG
ncbi:AAA family ATPase [Dellaglioa algida]|uniref:AAA family ATPase n=1 Tax=Dellaglioa algida TaxID=105612 RepID=UPI0024C4DFF7|nr:AAA family ATPase [Dellaglioa algida]MDK1724840.1 AAA family ATPase [Dellaglioa algida]MDK1738620.1 AAA family ATPase [Dellaglioa algida]